MSKEITYLNRTLSKGENILGIAENHWMVYFCDVIWIILAILLIPAGIGIFILPCAILSIWGHHKIEMIATNKRVIIKKGIIAVKTSELLNSKIESVSFDQGILGRLLGYGDIYFSGTGTTKMKFDCISEPLFIKSKFEDIIENSKK